MPSRAGGHALYLSLKATLELGGRLPLSLNRSIGPSLSAMAVRVHSRSRRRIHEHLSIAFPESGEDQKNVIFKNCVRHFGLMLAEVAWLRRATAADVEKMCELRGLKHLEEALQQGRGAILATAHCGNWELLSARIPVAGLPLTSAARQLDNPRIDNLVTSLRTRFGTEIYPRGPAAGRRLARGLKDNKVNALLIDQDIKDVPGTFVPFFGRPAWTPTGAAMFSIRMNSPVVPGFIHRLPNGKHIAEFHPPLPTPTDGSTEDRIEELTAAATAKIEEQIRAHPEQWVWMHRRWRRQPETE
jgi:KDO2-lipid IV(A) lauroyltransferase